MRPSLHARVRDAIRRNGMLHAGHRVGVGVSGGSDSVALLLLLRDLRQDVGITLAVLHFNHCLRGADSDEDERFVQKLAAELGVEFHCGSADIAAEALRRRWNLEDAARRLRYAFFDGAVQQGLADRVAVGHTADDQAETVLAKLLRGTGPAGLAGIYPAKGNVIRPLLNLRRGELRAFLQQRNQPWREDETNADTSRLRSRIRRELLPALEGAWQPAIVEHLNELARVCRGEEAHWEYLLDGFGRNAVTEVDGQLRIRIQELLRPGFSAVQAAPAEALRAASRRVIRGMARQCGEGQLHAQHVEAVLRLAESGSSGQKCILPGGLEVKRVFDRLVFSGQPGGPGRGGTGREACSYEYEVRLDGPRQQEIHLREIGKRLSLKVFDWPGAARETRESQQILNCATLAPPLVIRNWKPGDAYQPVGRTQTRRLKKLFLERRIPAEERRGWPVMTSGKRIVWALGLPAAAGHAANAGTSLALEIREETQ